MGFFFFGFLGGRGGFMLFQTSYITKLMNLPVLPHSVSPGFEGLQESEGETWQLRWAAMSAPFQPGPGCVEVQRLDAHRGLSLPPPGWKWPPHLQRSSWGSRSLWVLVIGMGPCCREELQSSPGLICADTGPPSPISIPAGACDHPHPRQQGHF